MNSIKCGHCGFIDWSGAEQCRRCANLLSHQLPAQQNINYEYLTFNDKKPLSHAKIGWIALITLVLFGAVLCITFVYDKTSYQPEDLKAEKSYASGATVSKEPVQSELTPIDKKEWEQGAYAIKSLACYQMEARVLGTKFYYDDSFASLCPVDFALGWGKMSDKKILDKFSIAQRDRKTHLETTASPIPFEEAAHHIANVHIIPANDSVRQELEQVKEGDIVYFKGYLVQVEKNVGGNILKVWKSSLSRTDSGDGACEIVWVESLDIKSAPEFK